ncbi:hypothetical protein IIA15_11990, partial [candidate division TA06 bacterium]|nr:hypothetical protein [candidate division TA06 bacterium]
MKIGKCLLGAFVTPILLGLPSVDSATVEVQIVSFAFNPDTVTITQGDSIRWVLVSGFHTTTSGTGCTPDGIWESGDMSAGDTFLLQFDSIGSFPYYCFYHCPFMSGEVIVQSGAPFHDGAVISLLAPPDTVFTDSTYAVMATVRNFGNVTEDSFDVIVTIDGY